MVEAWVFYIPGSFLEIYDIYTQTKKTVNAENIPGMCVLTNRARDLVTAENERVSQSRNRVGSRIVLKGLKI